MSETTMQGQKKQSRLSLRRDFNTMTWVLIPVAIAINIAVGQIVLLLKLPVYLDSIGTILVAVLCGPWAGALTGALSNTIWGVAIDPNALPWWPVAFFIGLVAGICAAYGMFKTWWKVIVTGFLVALTAATVSTPIAVYIYGGITASGSSFITAYLLQTGQGVVQAVFSTNFLVEPVDKITTCLVAFAIIQGLSRRFIARFPRPENVEVEAGTSRTQMFIAIGVVVLLVLFAAFMLGKILGG
ncbi:MAG: ECF transporter S component [Bacteroidota bacterium]